MRILTLNPEAEPETLEISPGCMVHALAHDGSYRFEPPKAHQGRYFMTGASRIDVAIRCFAGMYNVTITEGWNPLNGTLSSVDDSVVTTWDGISWVGSQTVATLNVVDGEFGGSSNSGPFLNNNGDTWASYRPAYLQDLRSVTPDNNWELGMDNITINFIPYDEFCPLKDDEGQDFQYGTVQEWTHLMANTHPLHIHMFHQQVVTNCGAGHDIG
jgi:hypothetical protein